MNKILTASREIIKGNFGGAVKSLSMNPSTYRGNMDFFIGSDGVEHLFKWKDHNSSLTAYTDCPPVTAVINRKAQAHINGKTWVMDKKGKEAKSKEAEKIRKLLANPNPFQSGDQFEAQLKIYTQIFGYCWLLPIIPPGFEKYGVIEATALWVIPPNMLTYEETEKLFAQQDLSGVLKNVKLTYKNKEEDIKNIDNLYLFKDFTPSFDSLIFPESRLRSLERPINNIIGAFESRNVLINYRGALGILSHEQGAGQYASLPMTEKQKEDLQSDFRRYGIKDHQWQFIITSASLKWQQMGVPTKDLLLMEEVQESSKSICDNLGYPPHLLGLIDPTFNNQNAAQKALYEDTIIPESNSIYGQWNTIFKTDELGLSIIKDYSHLAVLQEDKNQQATAEKAKTEALKMQFEMGLITLNDALEELGRDTIGEPGNVRATDPKNSNVPLAVTIGVGGVQSLISVLTAQGISADARQSALEIIFGLSPADAARMVTEPETNTNEENNQGGSGGNQSQGQGEENENDQSGGNS